MFGIKEGYTIKKRSHTKDLSKYVFLLTMRDDNIVITTEGREIVGGRVRMKEEEAEALFAESCAKLGIGEIAK